MKKANEVDFSLLPDVIAEVQEHLPQIEHEIHRLVQSPESFDLLASIFRRMHTIKGDFSYCRATPIADFVHNLESVLQGLRDRHFVCSPLVAEAMVQSLDQVSAMMQTLEETEQFDPLSRKTLTDLIQQLSATKTQAAADQVSRHILLSIHDADLGELRSGGSAAPAASAANIARVLDLGEQLAAALALRFPLWVGRAAHQRSVVLALNEQYRRPCNVDALKIATLWHDVGLLGCDDQMLQNAPAPKSPQWAEYATHPERAAAWLLAVAPDCTEAAQIIRQHHLWANGTGIPAPAYLPPPHPGALMLACADLLYDRVAGLRGEDYRRGVLRALFEINGGLESQFDAALINAFAAIAKDFTA